MANIIGTDGNDFIHPTGYAPAPGYNDMPLATAGDDTIDGGAGNDYIYGGDGNDTLSGGSGVNLLYGGNGDDLLIASGNAESFYGSAGRDTVSFANVTYGVTSSLAGWFPWFIMSGIEILIGSAFNDTLTGGGAGTEVHGGDGIDRLGTAGGIADGGAGNDIIGGSGTLIGGAGDDTLTGGYTAGSILIGGTGADHYVGEHIPGVDSYTTIVSYADNAVAVTLNLDKGAAIGGDATGDTFTDVDGVIGTAFDDRITGGIIGNRLDGGAGNDILAGAGGADRLDGGAGIDTAVYSDSTAGVQVSLGLGTGHGGTAEGDTLTGIESLIGSSHDDALTGDAGANGLWGGLGNDTLAGGAGNDVVKGEAGDDVLIGGAGADTLVGGDGIDTASYQDSVVGVTVDLGTGQTRFGDAQGDILNGIENLAGSAVGDRLTGDGGANGLSGGGGNDLLTGAGGADTLTGGAGADIFAYRAVGDSTVAAAGQDTIVDFNDLDGDKIDLRAIDADGSAGNGDQAFSFIGDGPFTHHAGEIRATAAGEALLVEGDVNGDGTADFAIRVEGIAELHATDFFL